LYPLTTHYWQSLIVEETESLNVLCIFQKSIQKY
jgi:hypothetical protein